MRTCNFVWGTANSIGNADWRRGEQGMGNMIGEWPHYSHEINKEEGEETNIETYRTEPSRTDPQRTAPKTNALSDVGSHAFCDRKSSCWGVEKSHVKCCNCCKLLLRLGNMATWQTSDWSWVGLAQAPGSLYCYVWSRVQFPILVLSFLALPVYDFINSRQFSSCASLFIPLSLSLSLECLQLATLHCRQISWLKDALAFTLQTGTHIRASYSCSYSHISLSHSLVQLASFIKIDRKS